MKRKRNKPGKVDGFTPISLETYAESHCRSNPGEKIEDVIAVLRDTLEEHEKGTKCHCGNPLWVIGSSVVGLGCFTCITTEAMPDSDYEIDKALEIRKNRMK